MRTLRITVIFLALTLILTVVFTTLHIALKPPAAIQGVPATRDFIETFMPIPCGLIAAPITLRLNRWIERRVLSNEKGKRSPTL